MMEVVWSSGFKRSFRKITKKNPQLKDQIAKALRLLADDPLLLQKSHQNHQISKQYQKFLMTFYLYS